MNINTMRHIDFWIGVPLCAALTLIKYLQSVFQKNQAADKYIPSKILFIKLSEMGAVVVAYPLLKSLKKRYPNTEFHFLTFEKSRHVFSLLNGLVKQENVTTIRDESFWEFVLDTIKALRKLRLKNFDITLDLEFFSRFSAILTYMSKAPKRVGFYRYHLEGLYRGDLLTHRVPYNPLIHMSQSYLSLAQVVQEKEKSTPTLGEIGHQAGLGSPQVPVKKEEIQKILAKLGSFGFKDGRRLFLLNPGEGMIPLREWPLENFKILIHHILADQNNYAALVGIKNFTNKDGLLIEAVKHPRCINLTGQTSLDELIALFQISEALVINDCGLAHLASVTPIKKIILWGPESPQVFSPLGGSTWNVHAGLYCSPCLSVLNHRNSSCKDNQCLKRISPEHVFNLLKQHCYGRQQSLPTG